MFVIHAELFWSFILYDSVETSNLTVRQIEGNPNLGICRFDGRGVPPHIQYTEYQSKPRKVDPPAHPYPPPPPPPSEHQLGFLHLNPQYIIVS